MNNNSWRHPTKHLPCVWMLASTATACRSCCLPWKSRKESASNQKLKNTRAPEKNPHSKPLLEVLKGCDVIKTWQAGPCCSPPCSDVYVTTRFRCVHAARATLLQQGRCRGDAVDGKAVVGEQLILSLSESSQTWQCSSSPCTAYMTRSAIAATPQPILKQTLEGPANAS